MILKFLGTGAADWADKVNGQFRANACALIDGAVLIDGTLRVRKDIKDPQAVTDVLYTHSHNDHFDPALLLELAPVRAHIHKSWAGEIEIPGVTVVPFDIHQDFAVAGMRVTALPSNHATACAGETTVHFILRKDGRSFFYATDGAWLLNAEWQALRKEQLDAAVFDATVGEMYPTDYRIFEHNTVGMVRLMTRALRSPTSGPNSIAGVQKPVLKEDAKVYLTHLARTLHPAHDEVVIGCGDEFVVAYDGLEVEI